jgi:hypothetical protein
MMTTSRGEASTVMGNGFVSAIGCAPDPYNRAARHVDYRTA